MRRDAPALVASRRFLFLSRVFHAAAVSLGGIRERTAFARQFFARGPHAAGGGRPRRSFGSDRYGGGLPFGTPPARRGAPRDLRFGTRQRRNARRRACRLRRRFP